MTATVSTKKETAKINPALHNWKSNIRESRKFSIILLILHLVAAPAVALAGIISIYSKNGGDDVEMYAVIAVCTTCLAAFLGIFAAVDSFRCLHDKSVVDMKLALPMSNTQRFFSNFLSGLFTYLAPFFTAQVLSVLLCGYGCLFMDGKTFYRISYEYSGSVTRPVEVPYVCDIFGQAMPVLLKLIVGGTLCMLMLYVITVLITICCGSKFEAIAYTILINVLIPTTILCVFYSMYENLYGIDAGTIALKVMLYISVAGGIVATTDWASQGDMLYSEEIFFNHGVWLLVFTLIIAALFALSFFLYRKRRAEQVSKPFVFKLAYYIVVTCAMFCIISLSMTEGGDLIPTIIISGIIYMIFEVVTNRGFKKFWLSAIKYAATFIAVVAVITIGEKTDGFGAVQRVPSASAVRSVELTYGGFYEDFSRAYDYSTGKPLPAYIIRDKENIETVVNAHQAIIDFYNEHRDYYDGYGYYNASENFVTNGSDLTITYHLKTGGSFTRTYYGYSARPAEILTAIDLSEEYRKQAAENYREYILNAEKYYEKEMEHIRTNNEYDAHTSYDASVTNRISYTYGTSGSNPSPNVSMESLVQRDFFNQLADAYYKDIMAITEENYFRSEYKNVWMFNVHCAGISIIIPESFTNTVELLEYFDFGLVRVEDFSDEFIYKRLVNSAMSSEIMLFTEDQYRDLYKVDDDITLHADYTSNFYRDYHKWKYETIIYDFDEELVQLVKSAMPRNIVAENGYVIYVSNFTGAIPEDMYGTASSVKLSGFDKEQQQRCSQLYNEFNAVSY